MSCWSGSRRQQGVRTFMAASASTTLLSTSRMRFSNTSSSLALNQRMEQPWLSTPTTRPTPSCKRTHVSNLCTKGARKCTWRARSAAAAAPVAAGSVAAQAVMWWACSTWHRAWARQEGSRRPRTALLPLIPGSMCCMRRGARPSRAQAGRTTGRATAMRTAGRAETAPRRATTGATRRARELNIVL